VAEVTAEIEGELLYPLLRGRDIRRWRAIPQASIVMVQDPVGRQGIGEPIMQRRYPKTYVYLKRFADALAARKDRGTRGIIEKGGPFYSVFGVGEYTLADWKVVWSGEVAPTLRAAVLGPQIGGRVAIPDQTAYMCAMESADSAHFLCALLNSTPVRFYYKTIAYKHTSMHFVRDLKLPEYDSQSELHCRLVELSREAHGLAVSDAQDELREVEDAVDGFVTAVLGLSQAELDDTRRCYAEVTKKDRETGDTGTGEMEGEGDSIADVLSAMDGNGEMTTAEIADAAGIDAAVLRPLLRQLIEAGQVEQTGSGRGTRYKLAEGGEA
jgi:hypothetical protein